MEVFLVVIELVKTVCLAGQDVDRRDIGGDWGRSVGVGGDHSGRTVSRRFHVTHIVSC